NTLFQLAVNQQGLIRGNYYDALMDSTQPVSGSVDKKTQRAAWAIGDKKSTVFETGFYNLTQDQTPVLVHFGKDRTQQWLLVRLKKPHGGTGEGQAPGRSLSPARLATSPRRERGSNTVKRIKPGRQPAPATPPPRPRPRLFRSVILVALGVGGFAATYGMVKLIQHESAP